MAASIDQEIASLEAYIAAKTSDPKAALAAMEGDNSPVTIRRRLAVLLDEGDVQRALSVVEDLEFDEEWAELGCRVFVLANRQELAAQYVRQLEKKCGAQSLTFRKVLCAYADAIVLHHKISALKNNPWRSEYALEAEQRKVLKECQSYLNSTLDGAALRVQSRLHQDLVVLLCVVSAILREVEESAHWVGWLARCDWLHHSIGKYMIDGVIPYDNRVIRRLVETNPTVRHAYAWALRLTTDSKKTGSDRSLWVRKVVELFDVELMDAKGLQRVELAGGFMVDLLMGLGLAQAAKLQEFAKALSLLRRSRSSRAKSFVAYHLFEAGETKKCLALLEKFKRPKDPLWLQIKAHCARELGRMTEFANALVSAARIVLAPELLRDAARASYEVGDLAMAKEVLELHLAYYPSDSEAQRNLAALNARIGEYGAAIDLYTAIDAIRGLTADERVERAEVLYLAGQYDRAKTEFAHIATDEEAPIHAIVRYAQILCSEGKAAAALVWLDRFRRRVFSSPEGVSEYMRVAHQAGQDAKAHSALEQLHQMSSAGSLPDGALKALSIDELTEEIRSWNATERELLLQHLRGILPWGLLASYRRNPLQWEWALRTQSARWVSEARMPRANLSVYSTNAFGVTHADEEHTITEIDVGKDIKTVCVDETVLVTATALGILGSIDQCFELIFLPQALVEKRLSVALQLFPHQRSRVESLDAVIAHIDAGDIRVVQDPKAADRHFAPLAADDKSEDQIGRAEICEYLLQEGLIGSSMADRLCPSKERSQETAGRINEAESLLIDSESARFFSFHGILETLAKALQLCILSSERDLLNSEKRAFAALDMAKSRYEEMWAWLDASKKVRYERSQPRLVLQQANSEGADCLAAFDLAMERELPLIVDDRCIQAIMINERRSTDSVAFGTDALIRLLYGRGLIDRGQLVQCFGKLMAWRYRFIILPMEVLTVAAEDGRENLPGPALRMISSYVQDCMRDPGLLFGAERADPPISVGISIFLKWNRLVAAWLVDVCLDDSFDDEQKARIIVWAMAELLPAVPTFVPQSRIDAIERFASRQVLVSCILASGERGNDAIRVAPYLQLISESLGVSASDLHDLAVEVAESAIEHG